ncbi:hypothetical protein QOZ80_2BG0158450 [Eleusine coracana subsp. coracana]|nr:hypothetical protein QOZ80_2BG0158450 [Eleusine coracana subsp. coracana]
MGVRSEFESIRISLLHDTSSLTMAKALSDLIVEETRLDSLAANHSSHNVLAATHKGGPHRGGSSPERQCKHCKKNTHRSDQCFTKFLEKLAEFCARGAAAQGRGTTSRASVSAATAVAPIGACTSSWALDSGASFYVTSDQSQLVDYKPVNDESSIQTADGSSHRGCDWDWPSP